MTARGFTALALALVLSTPAAAQRLVPVGTRVQVRLFERQRQETPRFPRGMTLRGKVTADSPDTIWIRPTPLTGVLAVPRSALRTLGRSRGEPRRGQSMVTEGIKGAFAGAIEAMMVKAMFGSTMSSSWFATHSYGEVAGRGATYGVAIGAVIGVLFPVEYWTRDRLRRD